MVGLFSVFHVRNQYFPKTSSLRKTLKLTYAAKITHTEGGVPVGPVSLALESSKGVFSYTTPYEVNKILNETDAQYIHALFALKDRKLSSVFAMFAGIVYSFFAAIENKWKELVHDVANGSISDRIQMPDDVRKSLETQMKPDPIRALELYREFEAGFEGIALRIWPDLSVIVTITTGSMKVYHNLCRSLYCRGIPFYSSIYGSSEGICGVNLWPYEEQTRYVLHDTCFYEFIPLSDVESEQPKTLFSDQVEVDGVYELVVTNLAGFYRFRMSDVVRIAGFYNEAPIVEYLYRQGQLLSVRGEKTGEREFSDAIMSAVDEWNPQTRIVDYTCTDSPTITKVTGTSMIKGEPSYVVFVELQNYEENKDLQALADKLEEKLHKNAQRYQYYQNQGGIGHLNVMVVKRDSFEDLKTYFVTVRKTAINQLKVPRVVQNDGAIQLLLDRVERHLTAQSGNKSEGSVESFDDDMLENSGN